MIDAALLVLQLLVAVVLLVAVLEALVRNTAVTAGLVLAVTVLEAALVEYTPAIFAGAYKVSVVDVVFSLVVAAAVARYLRMRHFSPHQRLLLLVFALVLLSLLRGLAAIGVAPAVVEFRRYLAFFGGALYFSTVRFSPPVLQRIGRLWVYAAVAQAVVVVLRWSAVFTGLNIGILDERYGTAIRAVDGPSTFFMAQAFLLLLPSWWLRKDSGTQRLVGAALLVVVILLNRRTVWAALAVGVVVMMWRNREWGRRAALALAGSVAVGCLITLALIGMTVREQEVVVSPTDTGTLAWRVEGWNSLLSATAVSLFDWAVGQPFGSGFEREVYENTKETNPHSFYVDVLLRAGVFGLLGLGTLLAMTGRVLGRVPPDANGPEREVLLIMLAAQAVWLVAWVPGLEQGLVTGLAVAAVRDAPRPALRAAGWNGAGPQPASSQAGSFR